jgi:hypothetical protein
MSNEPAVVEWVRRYFGSWWHAELESSSPNLANVTVLAQLDHRQHDEVASAVDASPHETISYARTEMRYIRAGRAITAHSVDGVAYTVADGAIRIAGTDPGPVASAACRLTREALHGALAHDGWVLLHASAVVRDGRAYLAFGPKGSGKTATALQLASVTGGALLANDRVFARADVDGTVVVLPWPAAVAVGLGLLEAAGVYDVVAAARHEVHPSTTAEVLDALARGDRRPIRNAERERKVHLYPDQFTSLLGLPLATSGAASAVLLPTMVPVGGGAILEVGGREIGTDDTFAGKEEDRYPNVFGLRHPETDTARDAVFRALNALPRWTITLTHDVTSNTAVLGEIRP